MSDWLNKILIKAKESFNLEDKDVQKIEEQIDAVEMTGVKNTADSKVLNKNNGNVPLAGSWANSPSEGEIEGFTLFKSTEQQSKNQTLTESNTNFVEIKTGQLQVEQRVNNMAQQISQQNKINEQQQNSKTTENEKQNKLPPFVESITYKDGKAITKLKNGQIKERLAAKGEPGYVKDGESMEERLTRFFGEDKFNKADTPEKKAELLRTYFEDYYKGMDKTKAEKEKLQAGDYMKLLKNTGMDSEYGNIMGQALHSLYDKNKVKAYQGGIEQVKTQDEAMNFTNGVISNIGLSGNNSAVQQDLITETATTAKQYNFRPQYVENLVTNFGFLNPDNARLGADTAFQLDAGTANTAFDKLLKNSNSTEAVLRENPSLNQSVKDKFGQEYDIVSISGEQVNICSAQICKMIEAGEIDNASAIFKDNKAHLSDTHKVAIVGAARTYSTNEEADIEQRKGAASLTVDATSRIDSKDIQLEEATQNVKAMANTNPEVKKAYLEKSGEKAGQYNDEIEVQVDEMNRGIDNKEQTYNLGVSKSGSTFAAENQKIIVQRTIDSGNEQAVNNIAENAYEYDLSNREDILKMLKETGYESTMKTLEEAKAKYEAEVVHKNQNKAGETTTTENKSSETSAQQTSSSTNSTNTTASTISGKNIENIINSATNTTQKAKQIKGLSGKEQEKAIEELMAHASIPEIKGYALSGLKSEVIGFLLNNFTMDNKVKLDSIKYLLSQNEIVKYDELMNDKKENLNFFLT